MKVTIRTTHTLITIAVLALVLFFQFFPVTIVPEWELVFVNKDGSRASSIIFEQSWKDYTLEWMSDGQNAEDSQTDSDGYVKLPARRIRVSIFQVLSSKVRDTVMSINPHSSFGPDTKIVCHGDANCVVSYNRDIEKPQHVVLW